MTSSRMSQTSGGRNSKTFLAPLTFEAKPLEITSRSTNGLNISRAISFGRPT